MKRVILTLLLVVLSLSLGAKEINSAKLDSLITAIESHNRGMGSLSVFKDGKELYQRSFGYADIERGIEADEETIYRIGSISKTYTATLIMKLIEQGELSLETKLDKFFPQIYNAPEITIKQMLGHRSGITNFTSAPDYLEWSVERHSKEQLLERIIDGGSSFAPGSNFAYSNSNYMLLAYIAEELTGKSYVTLIDEMIATPCGLKSTYVSEKLNPLKHEALSYIKQRDWERQPETDAGVLVGAGSLSATSTEVNIFLSELLSGRLLSEESLNAMKPKEGAFGLGIVRVPAGELVGFGHNGGVDGFVSTAYYFPESALGVALLQNGADYSLNEFLQGVIKISTGEEYLIPHFSETIELSEEEMEPLLGEYSTAAIPLDITIFTKEGRLFLQAAGQPSVVVECFEENKFKNSLVGVVLEFSPDEGTFLLKQHGAILKYQKKEEN